MLIRASIMAAERFLLLSTDSVTPASTRLGRAAGVLTSERSIALYRRSRKLPLILFIPFNGHETAAHQRAENGHQFYELVCLIC